MKPTKTWAMEAKKMLLMTANRNETATTSFSIKASVLWFMIQIQKTERQKLQRLFIKCSPSGIRSVKLLQEDGKGVALPSKI